MAELFPNGIVTYLVGGLITGAGIALAYVVTGRIVGVSGILTAAQSFWSRRRLRLRLWFRLWLWLLQLRGCRRLLELASLPVRLRVRKASAFRDCESRLLLSC